MTSHKDRLKTIAGKNTISYNRSSSLQNSKRSTAPLTGNGHKTYQPKSNRTYSDEDLSSRGNRSPVYINVKKENELENDSESPNYLDDKNKRNTKSMERLPSHTQSRHHTLKSTGSKPYLNISNSHHIYKSQSLKALKAAEPSKVLMKSSIQQEHHDKMIQEYFRGLTFGRARRPCQIATVMFVLFVIFFVVGLVIIGLTYLYQNIMPTLDIGVAIGPCILAGSFIFLGVGIKFIYDSHKLSRKERRKIGYKSYNQSYVGLRKTPQNMHLANEKLVSGSTSKQGITRKPNKLHSKHFEDQTLARSTQSRINNNTRTDKSSNV